MNVVAPSILSADFTRLGDDIRAVEQAGADWIHIDVMDGHFVPNITMGPLVLKAVRQSTRLPLDVHLMIENPDQYVQGFVDAGADYVSVHVETCVHLHRTIQLIREAGAKAGAVLNPATPIAALDWVLNDLDMVLVMSVNPGFGGQAFIPSALGKISALRRIIDERSLETLIAVDGGVNDGTIEAIARAGADVFIAGSAIFGRSDYAAVIQQFKEKIASNPPAAHE
jgi:ribulose-phosphate 3-epimerase